MKQIVVFFVLLMGIVISVNAQNDSILVRKGSRVAFQCGGVLSKSEVKDLLGPVDYKTYKKGHRKIVSSVSCYAAASVSFAGFYWHAQNELKVTKYRAEWPNCYGHESLGVRHPKAYLNTFCKGLILSTTFTVIGYWLGSKGATIVDGVCSNYNAKSSGFSSDISLSFVASPVNVGLVLSF